MKAFTVQRIDHVVLRVSDLEASIAFYEGVLGCTLDRRRPEFGMDHLRVGASMIDLLDVNGPLGARGGEAPGIGGRNVDHLCLWIDQFDEMVIHSHLRSFGLSAEPAQLRYGAEGTGKSLYFFDPDGNQIELKGPSCPSMQPTPAR
ncbi:VOC family protein [Stenotrophomonas maltophilia]|uniref:VOC family protein n=1 Tax=Stenotrophomonas maltophilia TaxID=40324 RepID=UPI0028943564|nr:VOC family protein [Stenotrophomonas maltophilia]MDT3432572.1 VOC family protein [Stenotrophomonas maltophilia]